MKKNNSLSRDTFATKWGFRLSCIGSAVGMGNIWLFPYRLGQLGGAAFLIPYILFVVLIGHTGLIGEMTLGRSMESGTLGAFGKVTEGIEVVDKIASVTTNYYDMPIENVVIESVRFINYTK